MRAQRLVSLLIGTALVFGASLAGAQQPAAPPPPAPPYGPPITLEQAKKVMAGAEAEAKKNSWNVVMVVLDSGGNLVMLQRMDGAQFGSIDVAKLDVLQNREAVGAGHFQIRDDESGIGETTAVRVFSLAHQITDRFQPSAEKMHRSKWRNFLQGHLDQQAVIRVVVDDQNCKFA